MLDNLVIGGGVIGLSMACELAERGRSVCLIDMQSPGRAASWAGAGMLPPASTSSHDPVEKFCHAANRLHAEWAERLSNETGINTGYRRCGAIYLARDERSAVELRESAAAANRNGITFDELPPQELLSLEPQLAAEDTLAAFLVPDECQLRNPWHLRALEAACRQRGVTIVPNAAAEHFEIHADAIEAVRTPVGEFRAEQYCVTTGAWSGIVSEQLGLTLPVKPIRGQIALLKMDRPLLARIINEGPRYLVPREDGRVLVGSTMEDVGFDTSTTEEAIGELLRFARTLAPALADATLEATWAGLRPASADGLPYLGRIPGFRNAYLAAGHTRSGLHLSPATAVAMTQLMLGETPGLDLTPFRVERTLR